MAPLDAVAFKYFELPVKLNAAGGVRRGVPCPRLGIGFCCCGDLHDNWRFACALGIGLQTSLCRRSCGELALRRTEYNAGIRLQRKNEQ